MTVPPSKTLLSHWIKNTSSDVNPDNPSAEVESHLQTPPDPQERRKAAKVWQDIFSNDTKPNKASESVPLSENRPTPTSSQDSVPKRRKRHINPHNPFNSYVVSLKFPHHLHSQLRIGPKPEETNQLLTNAAPFATNREDAWPLEHDGLTQHNGFTRPSFIHTFKVPKQAMKAVKPPPKTHSFFAKRDTSGPLKEGGSHSSAKLRPISMRRAPWSNVHIRPAASWDHTTLSRRRRSGVNEPRNLDASVMKDGLVAEVYIPYQIHKPSRQLVSSSQLRAMVLHSLSKASAEINSSLIDRIGEPKAFDVGQFENRLWCDIYKPDCWQTHATPEAASEVHGWLKKQLDSRSKHHDQKPRQAKRRTGYSLDDGFVVDGDSDNEPEDDVLIVSGPVGSGKTSAVYAAAKALDAFVFEVSSSVGRKGKELSSMLDGISQNHAVHKAKDVVILIDDADIVYENEAGSFWSTLSRFAATSRRPVVLTCANPRLVALSGVNSQIINIPPLNLVRVTDLCWLIALSEGHVVDRLRLARLVVSWRGDLRRALTQLQFWCQMGIGGSPSSEEWLAKEHELVEHHANRVLSQNTWFSIDDVDESLDKMYRDSVANESFACLTEGLSAPTAGLDVTAACADVISLYDTCPLISTDYSRQPGEETLSGNGALPLPRWSEPVVTPYRGNESRLHNIFAMESSYGTPSTDLACDVSPYMRHMVASDFNRLLIIQKALSNQTEREARMTRRALSANGIDSRQYLELSQASMTVVLNSGYPTAYISQP